MLVSTLVFIVIGSKQVAAAIALNLAVFSHILNHVLTRLQTALYEAKNPTWHGTEQEESSAPTEGANSISTTQLSETGMCTCG